MEIADQKMKAWERHPFLTLLVAMIANLLFVLLIGFAGALIQEHNPPKWIADGFGCLLFIFVFSIFSIALYLTGWGTESRLLRIGIVISGSFLMMIFWFIAVLILVFLGMGFLANLYS